MKKPRIASAATALLGGILLALTLPLAASAHVTISPDAATPGSYALVTVKVPNESDTATTNRVEVFLPTDTPFTSVRYVPVAGWTAELVRETLPKPVMIGESEITEAVTSVVWTAQPGFEIAAAQLQLFPLSLGPVPDTGSILLPTDQGYSDGTTVSWSEEGDDPEHPAPVLFINDAPVDHHAAGTDEPAVSVSDETPAAATTDVLARVLGIAGLIVGVVGLVVGFTARRRPEAR
ncbi:MAG: hypothetical protein JWP85_1578 [Rhodoglobus sp.]|nr:hypothetical protein [Rhodoglobus sp.]